MDGDATTDSGYPASWAEFSALAQAALERDLRELDAREQAGRLEARPRADADGPSVVFSLRLDRAERAALEQRALAMGVKPSVLARNYIRAALAARPNAMSQAVDRLVEAAEAVRSLAP